MIPRRRRRPPSLPIRAAFPPILLLLVVLIPRPALAADAPPGGKIRCQKSGCLQTGGIPGGGGGGGGGSSSQPFTYSFRDAPRPRPQRPEHRLYALLVEWVVVFSCLRLFLHLNVHGCRPALRRAAAMAGLALGALDGTLTSAVRGIRLAAERSRSRAGALAARGGRRRGGGSRLSRLSRGGGSSLGSLADLVGYYDEQSSAEGSALGSAYYDSSAADSMTASSFGTSDYTESESEATPSTVSLRRGRRGASSGGARPSPPARAGHRSGNGPLRRKSFDTLTSSSALNLDSSDHAVAASAKKADDWRSNSRGATTKGGESDASYDTSEYTHGTSSAPSSVLSKFMSYLARTASEEKEERSRPRGVGGRDRRRTSSFDRPLKYDDFQRRITVNTFSPNESRMGGNAASAASLASSSAGSSPHGNGATSSHGAAPQSLRRERDDNGAATGVQRAPKKDGIMKNQLKASGSSMPHRGARGGAIDDDETTEDISLLAALLDSNKGPRRPRGASAGLSADSLSDVNLQSVASFV